MDREKILKITFRNDEFQVIEDNIYASYNTLLQINDNSVIIFRSEVGLASHMIQYFDGQDKYEIVYSFSGERIHCCIYKNKKIIVRCIYIKEQCYSTSECFDSSDKCILCNGGNLTPKYIIIDKESFDIFISKFFPDFKTLNPIVIFEEIFKLNSLTVNVESTNELVKSLKKVNRTIHKLQSQK